VKAVHQNALKVCDAVVKFSRKGPERRSGRNGRNDVPAPLAGVPPPLVGVPARSG